MRTKNLNNIGDDDICDAVISIASCDTVMICDAITIVYYGPLNTKTTPYTFQTWTVSF